MERRTGTLLLALALAGYGAHRALTAIGMLPAPTSLPILLAFALEALLGLGLAIALTALIEVLLGVLGWLIALFIAVAAIAVALLLGAWLRRPRPVT